MGWARSKSCRDCFLWLLGQGIVWSTSQSPRNPALWFSVVLESDGMNPTLSLNASEPRTPRSPGAVKSAWLSSSSEFTFSSFFFFTGAFEELIKTDLQMLISSRSIVTDTTRNDISLALWPTLNLVMLTCIINWHKYLLLNVSSNNVTLPFSMASQSRQTRASQSFIHKTLTQPCRHNPWMMTANTYWG